MSPDPILKEWVDNFLLDNKKNPDLDFEVFWRKIGERVVFSIKVPKFYPGDRKYHIIHEIDMVVGDITFSEIPEHIERFVRYVFKAH